MNEPCRANSRAWLAAWIVFGSISSCGSDVHDAPVVEGGGLRGSPCRAGTECRSGVCTNGICVGNGLGAPAGSACSAGDNCASGLCVNGKCAAGSSLPSGSSCADADECREGGCSDGVCVANESPGAGGSGETAGAGGAGSSAESGGSPGTSGSGQAGGALGSAGSNPTTTVAPPWPGAGSGFRPLISGCGPDTATECSGECEQSGGSANTTVIQPPTLRCFVCGGDPTPDDPAAVVEQVVETVDSVSYVHLRVIIDSSLIDASYGAGSCCGWAEVGRTHKFDELRGGDHAELSLRDAAGVVVMTLRLDLISESDAFACGFGTLGVSDQEGDVTAGDAAWVIASSTSISRNLNGCGYCLSDACAPSGDCTVDSPTTDESYTPHPLTPAWDYRNVYEVWIDLEAFADAGFGRADITRADASPSKINENTLNFISTPCPPEWESP